MSSFLRITSLFAVVAIIYNAQCVANTREELPLMPWPTKVTWPSKEKNLVVTPNIIFITNDNTLHENILSWRQRIIRQTGWDSTTAVQASPTKITFSVKKLGNRQPLLNTPENYQLNITSKGINIQAETRLGILHGMETLLQLMRNNSTHTVLPLVSIIDSPRFPWRGLLLDSARHFIPIDDIKRQLDGMAAAKLNVFHWHLTDDQGWRFESKIYPKLQQLASDEQYYTQNEMRNIVKYASQLGIRVVPEIDLPGHASAIGVAYPEFMSAPGPYTLQREWGIHKATLNPTKDATYIFIDSIINELADIFPDPYIHIGGDEVDDTHWKTSEAIQLFMVENNITDSKALQAFFNQKVNMIFKKYNRQMIGWDEVYHADLPKETVIQSWQGYDSLNKTAAAGYYSLLSTGFYLDQPQYTSYHYRNELTPQPLTIKTYVESDETANSWQFKIPRLKGSAVEGTFTVITNNNNYRGFIDFSGRSRQAINNLNIKNEQLKFSTDTWMGPTQFVVNIKENTNKDYVVIGNVRYPLNNKKIFTVPHNEGLTPLTPKQASFILGGEITLWTENIKPEIIDVKLWPRTFAVAERLWSPKEITDENNMYNRLDSVDAWSVISVGLQHDDESKRQFRRLAQNEDYRPLEILAESLEPAHYYTRQHLKYKQGKYNQQEPLNRFVDTLPVESRQTRELSMSIDALLIDKQNRQALNNIQKILKRWNNNIDLVMPIIERNYLITGLKLYAEHIGKLSKLGLALTETYAQDKTLSINELQQAQKLLTQAAQKQLEIVIPMVYPLEKLLQAISVNEWQYNQSLQNK